MRYLKWVVMGLMMTVSLAVYSQQGEVLVNQPSDDSTVKNLVEESVDDFVFEPEIDDELKPEPELKLEDFLLYNKIVGENNEELRQLEQDYKEEKHDSLVKIGKFETGKELKEAKAEKILLRLEELNNRKDNLAQRRFNIEEQLHDEALTQKTRDKLEKSLVVVIDKQEQSAEKQAKLLEKMDKADAEIEELEAKLTQLNAGELPEDNDVDVVIKEELVDEK